MSSRPRSRPKGKPTLTEKLKNLPHSPGVYLMKDRRGEIIYVGKASSLADRVRSYFGRTATLKHLLLVQRIADVEVIPLASPSEALLLENKLIKQCQPKYNSDLKDGKSYPLLKITKEEYPAVRIVREEKSDEADYYGPFTNADALRRTVKFLLRYYPVRSCSRNIGPRNSRVCTQYHIGRCAGPCQRKISREEYTALVEGIRSFFGGHYTNFEKKLRKQMREAARELRFEDAGEIKEKLLLLGTLKAEFPGRKEEELVAFGRENAAADLGKILGLPKVPAVIEGYDISNFSGTLATGSRVVFKGGSPQRDRYRHYRIKTAEEPDDYRMLREVLSRRFDPVKEKEKMPDIILIDGGLGQLHAAHRALRELDLDIPAVALAKKHEEIYVGDRKAPLKLPADSPALRLLQRVRDEAHRFAIRYHKILRRKKLLGK